MYSVLATRDRCSLCGTILPYRLLNRCHRCGRLYCRNCVAPTSDERVLCLNCARRMVSPRKLGTKYSPLSRYLAHRAPYTDRVTLTFTKIEEIIGAELPSSALHYQHWWTNSPSRTHAQAWLDVGWMVENVDLDSRMVVFRRKEGILKIKVRKKGKRVTRFPQRSISPLRPRRRRTPSKTKIARAIARLRNIQQTKSLTQKYRGKLKPRTAHEKRLYKPEARP